MLRQAKPASGEFPFRDGKWDPLAVWCVVDVFILIRAKIIYEYTFTNCSSYDFNA